MKRDMELVRQILIAIEEQSAETSRSRLSIEGYSKEVINYHIMLLKEAGLIEARGTHGTSTTSWTPTRLTWAGHEFLDAARNESVWNNTKEVVKDKGGAIPFEVLKDLLIKGAAAYFGLI
jgi:predicted transcriptional regulator